MAFVGHVIQSPTAGIAVPSSPADKAISTLNLGAILPLKSCHRNVDIFSEY